MIVGSRPFPVVIDKRRPPFAGVVPGGGFNLDDISAQIRQRLPSQRSGKNARQLDHPKALKWRAHGHSPSLLSIAARKSARFMFEYFSPLIRNDGVELI